MKHRLKSVPLRMERAELNAIIGLHTFAIKHGLAAYDVAYLELARRQRLPLATTDQVLGKAALAEGT